MAGPYSAIQISQNNVTTSGSHVANTNTYPQRITGCLKRIIIDQSGISTNALVVIKTTASGALGYSRTLFTADNGSVLTDINYPMGEQMYQPSLAICTNTYSDGIELYNEQIQMLTSSALASNMNVKAWLIIENK
jgi:hypothetical protein